MMRLMITAGVFLALLFPSSLSAANDDIAQGMVDKAVSGAIDLVTGIVEWPMQTYKGYKNGCSFIENETGSMVVGTILGFFRGIGHAAGRTAWGGMELFGFWTANPKDNEKVGIPLDAQFAWEEGTQYSVFEPNLEEGLKPIGNKLVRGLADGFLAIAELPGQIMKGHKEGQLGQGIINGVWYWWSRGVYGFGSVWTCIVPNPKDNPGYAYDGEWPWSALCDSME